MFNKIIANICCRNIDNCKMCLLVAEGDVEINYWQSEIERWTKKLNGLTL